jgi:tripeptide aminopeptidase
LIINQKLIKRVLDRAIEIQQIPAPTFHEKPRAEFIQQQFAIEKLSDVSMDELGNVYGKLPGKREKRALVVSAHSDTVFPEGTDLTVSRTGGTIAGPGIGDNSLGVAGLFGLIWLLKERQESLPGDLWFVANVCEEGLGNLKGMTAVVDRFGEEALAYLVVEGMALGQIYHHGLEVQRYRITVQTPGGHSWVDYGRPSAIHVICSLAARLSNLSLPKRPRTTLNVGTISGGTSVNTIASHATIELDLRSEDGTILQELVRQVEETIEENKQDQVRITPEIIGIRPYGKISKRHPLVQLALRSIQAQGIQPRFNTGSTDANVPLSRGLPAICLGVSTGFGAHTQAEYIHTPPVAKGLAQLLMVVEGAYRDL